MHALENKFLSVYVVKWIFIVGCYWINSKRLVYKFQNNIE